MNFAKRCMMAAAVGGVVMSASWSRAQDRGDALQDNPANGIPTPAPLGSSLLSPPLTLAPPTIAPTADDVASFKALSLTIDPSDLLLQGKVYKKVANPSTGEGPSDHPVYYAADAMGKEAANVHGFIDLSFRSMYVTPRGLVVQNSGVVFQPVGGFVFPIGDVGPIKGLTFVTGIWNSIDSYESDTNVGPWDEDDFFASFSGGIDGLPGLSWTLTYGLWNFPSSTVSKPSAEHNLDIKFSYDDSKIWGDSGFALNPYVDFWWAISGSSTVVLGREGDTGYIELGVVPSYKWVPTPEWPITFTFPTYISVGPEHYWGQANPDGNFGVFSTSINATVPLNFIPGRYGNWYADAGVTYFYLINRNLLEAGELVSGNNNRNVINLSVGIGVKF